MESLKRSLVLFFSMFVFGLLYIGNANEVQAYAAHNQDEAIAWVSSLVGQSFDADNFAGAQCVDLILIYYDYLGVPRSSGNGCDYATNRLPAGWSRVQGGTPQKGDILVFSGNSNNPYGHVAIYESEYSTYHQNFDGKRYVSRSTYRYNGIHNTYWGCIRPDWSSDTQAPSITNVTISDVNADGYTVSCNISDDIGVTSVRFPSWNNNIHRGEDANWLEGTISGNTATCRVNISSLKSGAIEGVYMTHIYAYDAAGHSTCVNAGEIYIDRTPPELIDAKIVDMDDKGYYVEVEASDNHKISRVQCPTWSVLNGQDDLAPEWWINSSVSATYISNNKYRFRVNISDHNGETGAYETHVYVYDTCGNYIYGKFETISHPVITTKPVTKPTATPTAKTTAKPTAKPIVIPTVAPTINQVAAATNNSVADSNNYNNSNTYNNSNNTLYELDFDIIIKNSSRKIIGTVSAKNATVKIKIGKNPYKKVKVNGRKFTYKIPRLKKTTKMTIKVTKKGYRGMIKKYYI